MMRKIYSLEDDVNLNNLLKEPLSNAGFTIESFSDYRLFFDAVRKEKPNLILLDLTLPLINGEEVLKYLKSNLFMHNIPIIILSGKMSELDKVNCLDLGADDFVGKPFGILELISRINAVLRRFGVKNDLIYDNMIIDMNNYIVKINNEKIFLTNKEFDLLLFLLQRIDMIVTKEELVHKFWEKATSNSRSIDMHIKALRQKVFSKTKLEITTILKVGYKVKYKE